MAYDTIGDEWALRVKCPVTGCSKPKGEPCVHVFPREPSQPQYGQSRVYLQMVARAGTPTKRPHNERRALGRVKYRRRIDAILVARRTQAIAAEARQLEIARAEQQFQLREYWTMRSWLRRHGTIFQE